MIKHNSQLFLIGGGWSPESYEHTYGPFVRAASTKTDPRILLIIADEPGESREDSDNRFRSPFKSLSVTDASIHTAFVSDTSPLSQELVASVAPTGIFVCGGLTPLYQESLCRDQRWLDYLVANRIPYGGFSAGSAIAAEKAVVGGWKLVRNGVEVRVCDEEVSEDLEFVSVREGLGLVPFSIDVHCSQWGTITRLMHAVDREMIKTGMGIDEDTMLQVDGECTSVHGLGQIYRVMRQDGSRLIVEIEHS